MGVHRGGRSAARADCLGSGNDPKLKSLHSRT